MRRIESFEDQRRGVVTYELLGRQRVKLDERDVREYGAATIIRRSGYGHLLQAGRVSVTQCGRRIGTVPADFDPLYSRSKSPWYDFRPGDFVREGEVWVASRMLGGGDLEAVPGFVWDRE